MYKVCYCVLFLIIFRLKSSRSWRRGKQREYYTVAVHFGPIYMYSVYTVILCVPFHVTFVGLSLSGLNQGLFPHQWYSMMFTSYIVRSFTIVYQSPGTVYVYCMYTVCAASASTDQTECSSHFERGCQDSKRE